MTKDDLLEYIEETERVPLYTFRSGLNGEYGSVCGFFASYVLKADAHGCINKRGFLNERISSSGRLIPLTCDHDYHQVIGIVRYIEDRKVGVFMVADFLNTPRAQEVRTLVKGGAISQMSCILDIGNTETVMLPDGSEAIERQNCDLIEIALTNKPAQPCSIITDFT